MILLKDVGNSMFLEVFYPSNKPTMTQGGLLGVTFILCGLTVYGVICAWKNFE